MYSSIEGDYSANVYSLASFVTTYMVNTYISPNRVSLS